MVCNRCTDRPTNNRWRKKKTNQKGEARMDRIFHQFGRTQNDFPPKMHLFQFSLLISLDHYCNTFYGFGHNYSFISFVLRSWTQSWNMYCQWQSSTHKSTLGTLKKTQHMHWSLCSTVCQLNMSPCGRWTFPVFRNQNTVNWCLPISHACAHHSSIWNCVKIVKLHFRHPDESNKTSLVRKSDS